MRRLLPDPNCPVCEGTGLETAPLAIDPSAAAFTCRTCRPSVSLHAIKGLPQGTIAMLQPIPPPSERPIGWTLEQHIRDKCVLIRKGKPDDQT